MSQGEFDTEKIKEEKDRLYAPLHVKEEEGIHWKELNAAISKAMQNYCGGVKCDTLLMEDLDLLETFEKESMYRSLSRKILMI